MDENTLIETTLIRNRLSMLVREGYDPWPGYRERFDRFPYGCCRFSAKILKSMFDFNIVDGFIEFNGRLHVHSWNETFDGELVDITASQFGEIFPEIFVASYDFPLVKKHYIFDSRSRGIQKK